MKLLVITSRFPYPLEKGDKLRIFHQLEYLSRDNQIILISLSDTKISTENREVVEQLCEKVHILHFTKWQIVWQLMIGFMKGLPIQVSYFFNNRIKDKVNRIVLEESPDHIYCQLIRVAEYVRNLPFYKSIDLMDCFSLSTGRRAQKSPWYLRWFFLWEKKKVRSYEKSVFFDFNHHFVISEHDKEAFDFHSKSLIKVIPNGLDQTKFEPIVPAPRKEYDLVFAGNMGYYPNVEAAVYLVEKIMPLLPKSVNLLIAGARPNRKVASLGSSRVTVSGWVEDIRVAYQSGRIFLAPIFEGAGLQNKVLEAMSLEVPCIISPIVNNGINAIAGKHLLVASNPKEFAEKIIQLLENNQLQTELISEGKQFVENQYNWDLFNQKLESILRSEYDLSLIHI